jgi:hypothetical protein
MVPISCRNRWTGPDSPVLSVPASDPAKMRAVRAWVVAVIVTSARAGLRGERPPAAVAFDQVVPAVEPEVPAGRLVVARGEVDGLGNGAEQVLGVQRLAVSRSRIISRLQRSPTRSKARAVRQKWS